MKISKTERPTNIVQKVLILYHGQVSQIGFSMKKKKNGLYFDFYM